jgi:hypothetical protein
MHHSQSAAEPARSPHLRIGVDVVGRAWGCSVRATPISRRTTNWRLGSGGSATFSVEQGSQSNHNAPENSSSRLSDGTLSTVPGAFAPGVTLQRFDISLLAFDAALKHRGLSLSTEWCFQKPFAMQGNVPIPISSTMAYGGVWQGGFRDSMGS